MDHLGHQGAALLPELRPLYLVPLTGLKVGTIGPFFSGSLPQAGPDPSGAEVSANAPCVIRTHDRLLARQLLDGASESTQQQA